MTIKIDGIDTGKPIRSQVKQLNSKQVFFCLIINPWKQGLAQLDRIGKPIQFYC